MFCLPMVRWYVAREKNEKNIGILYSYEKVHDNDTKRLPYIVFSQQSLVVEQNSGAKRVLYHESFAVFIYSF